LLTNLGDNGDGNGWELDAGTAGWFTYSLDWGFFPNSMGNDIQAITCGGAPVANFESSVLDNLLTNCALPATIQFYNTSYNGVNSISWSFAGGTPSTSTSANPSVSYSAAGSYTVVLTAVGTSSTDTIVSTVNIYPTVTATTSTTPATGPTLSNGTATATPTTGVGPYTYLWSAGAQDTFATASGLAAGSYTVTVVDADGCGVVETAVVALVNGILTIGANTVNIYPSPVTDVLHIDWSAATIAGIRITDMSGKEMIETTTGNNLHNAINISGLATGTYILTIRDTSTGAMQSVKFVKM
jgi:PKD repeat protein